MPYNQADVELIIEDIERVRGVYPRRRLLSKLKSLKPQTKGCTGNEIIELLEWLERH